MPRPFARILTACAAALLGSSLVATEAYLKDGYLVRVWTPDDGLPRASVNAVAQTGDGFLWIATSSGVARFDGLEFANMPVTGHENARVTSLDVDRDGLLSAGLDDGAVTHQTEVPSVFQTSFAYRDEGVLTLARGGDGYQYVVGESGTLTAITPRGDASTVAAATHASFLRLIEGLSGEVWFVRDGELYSLAAGKFEALHTGLGNAGAVETVGPARQGGLWVIQDGRLRRWHEGGWREDRGRWDLPDPNYIVERADGTVVVGTIGSGIRMRGRDGSEVFLDQEHGGIPNWIRTLFEDRDGNLWIGAGSGGLAMVRSTPFDFVRAPDNWQGRSVLCVASAPDGTLWVGTEGAGIYRLRDGQWKEYGITEGVEDPYVWSLAVAENGDVWAGTWNRRIFRLEGERFTPVAALDPLTSPILGLRFQPRTQRLWIGTRAGLYLWEEEKLQGPFSAPGPRTIVQSIEFSGAGDVWVALQDQGLARWEGNRLQPYTNSQPAALASVDSMLFHDDVLWAASFRHGLLQVSRDSAELALACKEPVHLERDGDNYLWVTTLRGLLRVGLDELLQRDHLDAPLPSPLFFDRFDGLPALQFTAGLQAASCASPDGNLWFAANSGVLRVRPKAVAPNLKPPQVFLRTISVDAVSTNLDTRAHSVHVLPPNHNRVELAFTAPAPADASKIRFTYRLEGQDESWSNPSDRRFAVYSRLPPGDYRFQVIAINAAGVPSTESDTLALRVEPHFWQTWWFRSLAALSAVGAVILIVRAILQHRYRRRLAELERARAIERERARIAEDIHDDIGSQLTRISMLSETAGSEPAVARQALHRIHRLVLGMTSDLDEIVWAVDPRHDSLDSLIGYVSRYAQETLAEASIACRIEVPLHPPDWPVPAQVRHNLLLAFKEAVTNIVKHAGATEVRLTITLMDDEFSLSLQDNGKGAVPAADDAVAGNGLRNMKRRLHEIGGTCRISSRTGGGWITNFIVRRDSRPLN